MGMSLNKRLSYLLCLSCVWLCSHANALSIVTWNTEHFMDEHQFTAWKSACEQANWDDAASTKFRREPLPPCDALSGFGPPFFKPRVQESLPLRDWKTYQLKVAGLRERAAALNADVILFQEVGSVDAVKMMLDATRYDIWSTQGAAKTPLNLAVAVRKGITLMDKPTPYLPLAKTVMDDKGHERQLRPGMQLALQIKGQRVEVLNVHLKSGCRNDVIDQPKIERRDDKGKQVKLRDCAQLRLQIPEVEAWIEQRQKSGTPFIVAGDFNRSLWAERKEHKPARCDASDAAAPLGTSCLANPLAEWDDTPSSKLYLAQTQMKAYANGAMCAIKPNKRDGEPLCHCGIDHFLVNEQLLQKLGINLNELNASGEHYGALHYGVSAARPSDHCALKLQL
jgi:endonuclease/exonuclease/phosphatase family metal-dependent hydrolase